jgi:hypothetical protein
MVTPISACPSTSMMALAGTPWASRKVAHPCRRSCSRSWSRPALFRSSSQRRFTLRGSIGVPMVEANTSPCSRQASPRAARSASCRLWCSWRYRTASLERTTVRTEVGVLGSMIRSLPSTRCKARRTSSCRETRRRLRRRWPALAPTSGLGEAPVGARWPPRLSRYRSTRHIPARSRVLAEAVFLGRPVSSSRSARQSRSLRSRRVAIGWRRP